MIHSPTIPSDKRIEAPETKSRIITLTTLQDLETLTYQQVFHDLIQQNEGPKEVWWKRLRRRIEGSVTVTQN